MLKNKEAKLTAHGHIANEWVEPGFKSRSMAPDSVFLTNYTRAKVNKKYKEKYRKKRREGERREGGK